MQLFVTYIVLFVTAVKARFSDFLFFHCGPYQRSRKLPISASDCRATSNDFRDLNMQLFVTYIVLFVTAVKARFSDFYFFHCGPYLIGALSL